MNDFYETQFGFYDHLKVNKNRPMSSVAMFRNEMNGYNSNLYSLFKKYHEAKILKYFGLNLLEFLYNPREQIEWMLKLSEEFIKADLQLGNAAAEEFKKSLGGN